MKWIASLLFPLALGCTSHAVRAQDDRGLRLSDQSPAPVFERMTPEAWVVNQAGGSVVNISVIVGGPSRVTDPTGLFFRGDSRSSQGSGVVIAQEGYIITNAHVIQGARQILVKFNEKYDSNVYEAEVIATKPNEDLALLKIEKENEGDTFPFVKLGRSNDLMIGEKVIAIGNPFGRANTVSSGILSATDREIQVRDPFTKQPREFKHLLQTDASINPGNSGGPLLNVHAELIGINNAILASAQGISFAIPADRVTRILEGSFFNVNKTTRFDLGFEVDQNEGGLTVRRLDPESFAARSGLEVGDQIVSFDGDKAGNMQNFSRLALAKSPGEVIEIGIQRDSTKRNVDFRLGDFVPERFLEWRLGISVRRESYLIRRGLYRERRFHVEVQDVRKDSPAWGVGLEKGDIVWRVGNTEASVDPDYGWLQTPEDLASSIRDLVAGEPQSTVWICVYRLSEAKKRNEPYLVGEMSL